MDLNLTGQQVREQSQEELAALPAVQTVLQAAGNQAQLWRGAVGTLRPDRSALVGGGGDY